MKKLKCKDLVGFLLTDEDQLNIIKNELVPYRKGSLRAYIKRGIFYSQDLNEVQYIADKLGLTLEEFGVTEENKYLFEGGFIVPVWDSRNEILFFINYDFRRDKSKKYINIYTDFYGGREKEVKMYGLHNTKQALEEDWIVAVEGLFDVIRLEMHGIPASAGLGTKIMKYHKSFYKRFKTVIYIEDNDSSGATAGRKFKKEVPHAELFRVRGSFGDVDDFGGENNRDFKQWLEELKAKGNRK